MSSKCVSSSHAEYVPVLCTHHPSLLPIGCASEAVGLIQHNLVKRSSPRGNGEVVTRFPLVNQWKDH